MAKLIVTIEDELHQAFRITCLRERKTMREKITQFIEADRLLLTLSRPPSLMP